MILSLMNYTFDLLIYDPRFLSPKHKFNRIDNMGKKLNIYSFLKSLNQLKVNLAGIFLLMEL
jgi:hypothetical protein